MHKTIKKSWAAAMSVALMTSAAAGGGGGGAAPAFVQSKQGLNGATDTTVVPCVLDGAVGSGNGVIVVVHSANDSGAVDSCTVTDNQSNVYTAVDSHHNAPANYSTYTFYCADITNAPTTVTATLGVSRQFAAIYVAEFTNIKAASPLDGNAIASTNGVDTPDGISSGSIVPTTDGDLIFGYAVDATSNGISAITTGFTADLAASNTWYSEYLIQSTAASIAALFTGVDVGVRVTAIIMALKRK